MNKVLIYLGTSNLKEKVIEDVFKQIGIEINYIDDDDLENTLEKLLELPRKEGEKGKREPFMFIDGDNVDEIKNLGINGSEKLSVYNPFLNYTDDELKALFTRSSKDGNNYSFTIDGSLISSYLDSMGSVTIEDATLDATIEDNYITSLTLGISGLQDVETQQVIIDVTIECTLDQINSLDTVTYPADLENY